MEQSLREVLTAAWRIGHGIHLAVALTVGSPRTWRLAIKHVPIGALKFAETLESFRGGIWLSDRALVLNTRRFQLQSRLGSFQGNIAL